MEERKPENIKLTASYTYSRAEYEKYPDRFEAFAREKLVREIAEHIAAVKVQEIKRDCFVERRIDVYVTTADEFWGIVESEATRIATMFMPRP